MGGDGSSFSIAYEKGIRSAMKFQHRANMFGKLCNFGKTPHCFFFVFFLLCFGRMNEFH